MQKYKLTEETITRNGVIITLHQIEALRDFADVKVGDKGGFFLSRKWGLSTHLYSPLTQLVEYYTDIVGVVGSSPTRTTP